MRYANRAGYYELTSFPGCNQLVVSHHALIYPDQRGKGIGTTEHNARLEAIKELGFDCAICTVRAGNDHQRRILTKAGWSNVFDFVSSETNNKIEIWAKRINERTQDSKCSSEGSGDLERS